VFTNACILIHVLLRGWAAQLATRPRRDSAGQSTAEYALVLLGAAAVALMLVAWAAKSDRIGRLFDAVFDQLIDEAG
jgi:hypothetical protein